MTENIDVETLTAILENIDYFPYDIKTILVKTWENYYTTDDIMILSDLIKNGVKCQDMTKFLCGAIIVLNDAAEIYFNWLLNLKSTKYDSDWRSDNFCVTNSKYFYTPFLQRCVFGQIQFINEEDKVMTEPYTYIKLERCGSSWYNLFGLIWGYLSYLMKGENLVAYGHNTDEEEQIDNESCLHGPYGISPHNDNNLIYIEPPDKITMNDILSKSTGSVLDIYLPYQPIEPREYIGFHIV